MSSPGAKLEADEEADLLLKIQSGSKAERAAEHERLFVALRQPIFSLCLQLTGNAMDAEEALQESFIAAFRGLSKFRGEARISTWPYPIAVREALRQKKIIAIIPASEATEAILDHLGIDTHDNHATGPPADLGAA